MFVANGSWEDGWSEGRMVDFQPLSPVSGSMCAELWTGIVRGDESQKDA